MNFTSPPGIPPSSAFLKLSPLSYTLGGAQGLRPKGVPLLEVSSLLPLYKVQKRLEEPPTCSLRPIIPNNASPPRITAAAGTELAGTFPPNLVIISSRREGFTI